VWFTGAKGLATKRYFTQGLDKNLIRKTCHLGSTLLLHLARKSSYTTIRIWQRKIARVSQYLNLKKTTYDLGNDLFGPIQGYLSSYPSDPEYCQETHL
jgi:hypothetical protein